MMDSKKIEQLIKLAKQSAISELTVRRNGVTVSIKKPMDATAVDIPHGDIAVKAAAKTAGKPKHVETIVQEPELQQEEGLAITAPMVGIFHRVDGIGEPGIDVRAGQVVGLIESMKLMNEITSPEDGVLAEVLIEDGTPVEYGQALFSLKKE